MAPRRTAQVAITALLILGCAFVLSPFFAAILFVSRVNKALINSVFPLKKTGAIGIDGAGRLFIQPPVSEPSPACSYH